MVTSGGDWRNPEKHITNIGITSATLHIIFSIFTHPSGSLVILVVVL